MSERAEQRELVATLAGIVDAKRAVLEQDREQSQLNTYLAAVTAWQLARLVMIMDAQK